VRPLCRGRRDGEANDDPTRFGRRGSANHDRSHSLGGAVGGGRCHRGERWQRRVLRYAAAGSGIPNIARKEVPSLRRGEGSSGTSTPRKSQSGSQPCFTSKTSSWPAGTLRLTSATWASKTSKAYCLSRNLPWKVPSQMTLLIIAITSADGALSVLPLNS